MRSSWHSNLWMAILESCKHLLPLSLSKTSLLTALIRSQSELLPISLLTLSHLIAKVHGCKTINQTILILETLLGHIQCLLHCHGKCDTKREDEAGEDQNNVQEIDSMRSTPRRANKGQLLEMNKAVVDKGEEDWTEDHEAKINYQSSHSLHKIVSDLEG